MPRGSLTRNPAKRYLPEVAAAEKAGLLPPGQRPDEVHKLCALVVLVRVLGRKQWREDKILRWRWARRMRTEAPPVPKQPASTYVTCLEETFETRWCKKCRSSKRDKHQCRMPSDHAAAPSATVTAINPLLSDLGVGITLALGRQALQQSGREL